MGWCYYGIKYADTLYIHKVRKTFSHEKESWNQRFQPKLPVWRSKEFQQIPVRSSAVVTSISDLMFAIEYIYEVVVEIYKYTFRNKTSSCPGREVSKRNKKFRKEILDSYGEGIFVKIQTFDRGIDPHSLFISNKQLNYIKNKLSKHINISDDLLGVISEYI